MSHGIASTKGHDAAHGGLRGHSIDQNIYPFIVYAAGIPGVSLRWHVRHPTGTRFTHDGCLTAARAYHIARLAKQQWLQEARDDANASS